MKRALVVLVLLGTLVVAPVCAAGTTLCSAGRTSPCCCGDEASCPCAHSHGQTPAPQPAAPTRAAAPEQLGPASAAAVVVDGLVPCELAVHVEAVATALGGSASLHISNCIFRC